ncbi:tetratricopeptide repeat protein [Calidithermus timidus]|jgi:tetratricopeptide (TPR) repeat protein|uniref:tetratricopeptide repeat protein n=1 Tax=Calidithermus timidus TaxID=307124 RepID=UPI0003806CE4|nr:tetratricopeptide repeat protein [Calidithermus timidus]
MVPLLSRRQALKGLLGGAVLWAAGNAQQATFPQYPYHSSAFGRFLEDSYALAPAPKPKPFRGWLEAAYQAHDHEHLEQALTHRRARLEATRDPRKRAALEEATAIWLHRVVKTLIPRFSLERGFEFFNAVRFGERQCLLQSVLIAGLLQGVGLEAGVVMVWKNPEGKESNLGHAVALLRGSDGQDRLVDASDPTPFMRHPGLYLWDRGARDYRFVEAHFGALGAIRGYTRMADGKPLPLGLAQPLDVAFLRSQFDYYRGERAPGGFIGPSTPAGLEASARFLERATARQPRNPLAVYGLGYVYRKQGRLEAARKQFQMAYQLYLAQGHVPSGPQEAQRWAEA